MNESLVVFLWADRRRDQTERRVLTNAAELRQALEIVFRLTLPDAPELDVALEWLTARAP